MHPCLLLNWIRQSQQSLCHTLPKAGIWFLTHAGNNGNLSNEPPIACQERLRKWVPLGFLSSSLPISSYLFILLPSSPLWDSSAVIGVTRCHWAPIFATSSMDRRAILGYRPFRYQAFQTLGASGCQHQHHHSIPIESPAEATNQVDGLHQLSWDLSRVPKILVPRLKVCPVWNVRLREQLLFAAMIQTPLRWSPDQELLSLLLTMPLSAGYHSQRSITRCVFASVIYWNQRASQKIPGAQFHQHSN